MAEKDLKVVTKAIDLMKYTFTITTNRKRYPQKYLVIVRELQSECINIYKSLFQADRINLSNRPNRIQLQTDAINSCDELSCFVELSMNLGLISAGCVEEWQKKISDIKYMTIAWRTSDSKRQI